MDPRERIAANRRRLADFFDSLDDHQLGTPSLCEAWTVREVLGHLAMPLIPRSGLMREVVRARGSLDRASVAVARRLARRPVAELTAVLRERAEVHPPAPGVDPIGQFADGCLHLRDCARPLGLPAGVSPDDWRLLLERLPHGLPGLVPRRRAAGLRLVADDQPWTWGSGAEITGRSEALAMALAGRVVALDDLRGDGVAVLASRLG